MPIGGGAAGIGGGAAGIFCLRPDLFNEICLIDIASTAITNCSQFSFIGFPFLWTPSVSNLDCPLLVHVHGGGGLDIVHYYYVFFIII